MFIGSNTTTRFIASWSRTHTAHRGKKICSHCEHPIHTGEEYRLQVYVITHPKYGSRLENHYLHQAPCCPLYRVAAE